jgi:hypothetical protein
VTDWPPADPTDPTAVADRRDEFVAAVRDHAGRLAYQLAKLQGGDYGDRTFQTPGGEWTVKYEGGDLEYLRYESGRGAPTYVVSSKRQPDPGALADALADYPALVAAFDEYVASLEGVLDGVETDFPAVASTDGLVADRQQVLEGIRETCDRMAGELHRIEGGDYGTYTARVDGTRWELKWDGDRASYLRIGGSGGVYLLSQYGPPSVTDVRELAPRFAGFVDAYNEEIAGLEGDA